MDHRSVSACRQDTQRIAQRSHTTEWHNNFDRYLTCSGAETRAYKHRSEDGGYRAERRAAQPALWIKELPDVPAVNSKVWLYFFFFFFTTPIKDSEIQTTPPLYQISPNCFLLITRISFEAQFLSGTDRTVASVLLRAF